MLAEPDCVPEYDEDQLFELCPDCGDHDFFPVLTAKDGIAFDLNGGCTTCWDLGVIEHACPGEPC